MVSSISLLSLALSGVVLAQGSDPSWGNNPSWSNNPSWGNSPPWSKDPHDPVTNCAKFAKNLQIANTTVLASSYLTNGSTFHIAQVPSCGGNNTAYKVTNNVCRLSLSVATSSTSAVTLEAWLPDPSVYTGRFMATGTGGEGGCIDFTNIQYGAQLNFATFGMNAGHDGQTGFDFFLHHPEVINDFGYRSMHVEAVIGKAVTKAYYGKDARYSYYNGCSTGGRQGFGNAQNYPDDFDGMLLGSPGIDWLHIVSSKGILAHRIGWPNLNSFAYVRQEQWPAIVAAIVAMLDPLDGVTDGIIDEPTHLRFDPAVLACGTGVLNASLCLTPPQIQSVRGAYEPIADTAGVIVYPSFELGSDTSVFSVNQVNGVPQMSYTILQDYWRGAIYNDSTWTPLKFNETDMDFAVSINPGRVNVGETDLSTFYKNGHKIISYHGRNDPTVTSALSERYFSGVAQSVNLTIDGMHDFYRLFFIPGMHHCSGGPGAWDIGQTLDARSGLPTPADHNALLSLVKWVEKDEAPDYLIGTKYTRDNSSLPVLAQRTHCVYPNVSRWDGVGNTTLASSWKCVAPGMLNYL